MSSMDTFLRDKSFSATTNTVLFTARWKRKGLGRNRKQSDPPVPQPRSSLGELTAIKGSVADMEGMDGLRRTITMVKTTVDGAEPGGASMSTDGTDEKAAEESPKA
jgi:hypothetical protein